jgi:hypothetical protein
LGGSAEEFKCRGSGLTFFTPCFANQIDDPALVDGIDIYYPSIVSPKKIV